MPESTGVPPHVAIIMDGNGRWAERQGYHRLIGHREGYRTLRSVLLDASDLGVRYLTAFAFSAENWRRPSDEVDGLLALIEQAARDELRLLHQNRVRVLVAGRMDELPDGLRNALLEGQELTRDNTGITFILAINYGGRAEIVDAVRALFVIGCSADDIDEQAIERHLYHPEVPHPDLVIRTAGEMRLSNFLIWQAAYAELFVSELTWPEFNRAELVRAIEEYQRRVRKFGGLAAAES